MRTFELLLTYLVLLLEPVTNTTAYIHRLSCRKAAHFTIIKTDEVLQGFVFGTFVFTTLSECQEKCLYDEQCWSINYQHGGANTCELNSVAVVVGLEPMVVRTRGWSFMSTDYTDSLVGNSCQERNPCGENSICLDGCECGEYHCYRRSWWQVEYASTRQESWPDCESIRAAGYQTSGVYKIKPDPDSNYTKKVYCDLQTDNHGWIVIQRRSENNTKFDRVWDEYKHGFGNLQHSFWLGNDMLHILTTRPHKHAMLRVEVKFINRPNLRRYAVYTIFRVGNESMSYKLTVGGYQASSTMSDGLTDMEWDGRVSHDQQMFSTIDRENDPEPLSHCAAAYRGGWWYSECYLANLNGLSYDARIKIDCKDRFYSGQFMTWFGEGYCYGGILFSEMKIRYQ